CTRFEFSQAVVEPGQVVSAVVRAVAPASPGLFQVEGEFTETHPDGRITRDTLSLHGQVLYETLFRGDPSSFTISRPELGPDKQHSRVTISGEVTASSLSPTALPRSIICEGQLEGIEVSIEPGSLRTSDSGIHSMVWKTSITVDASDALPRKDRVLIRIRSVGPPELITTIPLVFLREEPYPFEQSVAAVEVQPNSGYLHQEPIMGDLDIRVIRTTAGSNARIIDVNGQQLLEIEGHAPSASLTFVHSIWVQCGSDWPVAFVLSGIKKGS
ncbi:MAG: hypothetical protein ACI9X4_002449, partial [Glaciecola sp.]